MRESVLIVDDSLTVRMDVAEALGAAGFRTFPCGTATQAREILARESVDAVVLDVLLPDGNGVDLLKEVRALPDGSRTVVLMLSTEAEVKDRIRGLTTGADEYVGKPYDSSYVVAKIRELLRTRPSHAADEPTILVIDDSATFREELRKTFEAAGYRVLLAPNGEEGLRLAAGYRPTAIVVDGVLPGIDGTTVIRRVRLDAALRDVPCLLLTASEDNGAELRALDAGADAFVRKEEDAAIILAKLTAILHRTSGPLPTGEVPSVLGPKKILAVDDSATYLGELAGCLRHEGYDVILARSGEEAIELLAVQSVDCILLDLQMPGLGGQATCLRIKSAPITRDIPLVILTALEGREAMIQGLGAGADDYIQKSGDWDILKARVRAQIRRKQFEDENRRIREELQKTALEAAEARAARELADTRAGLVEELERKNQELESFSYSVSHDLRAPLRTIDGFSRAVIEVSGDRLGEKERDYLRRIRAAAQRMGELIDDLLQLSRVNRAELARSRVNLSAMARAVADECQRREPERKMTLSIAEELYVGADNRLLRVLLENLIGNAWKFTARTGEPRIDIGAEVRDGGNMYFVRDNGAGFDMAYAEKLFRPFQRLHTEVEFPGTGIGLATVYRIIDRHGGRIWAEGAVNHGATFYFTLARPLARPPISGGA